MIDELVSHDTAKLAKEKGFDEQCQYFYNEDSDLRYIHGYSTVFYSRNSKIAWLARLQNVFSKKRELLFTVPTQSLLQRWLREIHKIDIYVQGYGFGYYPVLHNVPPANQQTVKYVDRRWNIHNKEGFDNLENYEDALEEGLKQALRRLI